MNYRREIDGLRAVAVLSVIFFHAGFETFGGGFVGVDVFFVISGYLITSIIIKEREAGTFSILHFYERRVRRILPALFIVMLACVPFAWFWLLPRDLNHFALSLIAVSFFGSNILFWRQSGYFDAAAELKPLLHTWSLSVEEQFYVIFPLLLIAMFAYGRRMVSAMLVGIAAISLLYSEWMLPKTPEAMFFLLPSRVWELVLGSLIALNLTRNESSNSGILSNPSVCQAGSLAGLAMIVTSVLIFDNGTRFPGLHALLPAFGAALVILFGLPHTLTGKVLGSKALVGVGLISYSAYLWHQPIFAFARHKSLAEPSVTVSLILIVGGLGMAYLSWRFVEKPFRIASVLTRRQLFSSAFTATILFAGIGFVTHKANGFENIFVMGLNEVQAELYRAGVEALRGDSEDSEYCHFHSSDLDDAVLKRFDECYERHGKALVVLGDSHSVNLFNAISRNSENAFIFGFGKGGCRPHTPSPECRYDAFSEFAALNGERIELVIYTQAGFYLLVDEEGNVGNRSFFRRKDIPIYASNPLFIEKVADYLGDLGLHVDVVWLGPRVEPHQNVPLQIKAAIKCERSVLAVPANTINSFVNLDRDITRQTARRSEFRYLSQVDAVNFKTDVDLYDCNAVYWRDGDHWSKYGEERFGERIVSSLSTLGLLDAF